jgi:hypothetical protein
MHLNDHPSLVRRGYELVSPSRSRSPLNLNRPEASAWLQEAIELYNSKEPLGRNVLTTFPTPFARAYHTWQAAALNFWRSRHPVPPDEPPFETLNTVWASILHFLSFVFMVAVNRLDRALVESKAPREVRSASRQFKRLYMKAPKADYSREKAERAHHIGELRLVRDLTRVLQITQSSWGNQCIFYSLVEDRPFAKAFPETLLWDFEALRRMYKLSREASPDAAVLLYAFGESCCLHLLSTLCPLFDRFRLWFVTGVDRTQRIASGIRIDGLTPLEIRFRLGEHSHGEELSIEHLHLYLIDSTKEQTGVEAPDCLKLTPFLLYGVARTHGIQPPTDDLAGASAELFGFRRCDDAERVLYFLQFAYGAKLQFAIRDLSLYEEYDSFRKSFVRESATSRRPPSKQEIANVLSSISALYLARLIDTGSAAGSLRATEADARAAARYKTPIFSERLFVWGEEAVALRSFLDVGERACIVVGPSGIGKSALACALYNQSVQQGRLCLFLNARLLPKPDLRGVLEGDLAKRVLSHWTLEHLWNYLSEAGLCLLLVIDAVNEHYTAAGGAHELLKDIVALATDDRIGALKILATCRSETWSSFQKQWLGEGNPLPAQFWGNSADRTFVVRGFKAGQDVEHLYAKYQQYFSLYPESYRQLSPTVQNLIRLPLMLAVISDIYSNRERTPDSRRAIPPQLDYFTIFKELTTRKLVDAARLLAPNDAAREHLGDTLQGYLLNLARVIYAQQTGSKSSTGLAEAADAVRIQHLHEQQELRRLLEPISLASRITPLEVLLELGLLERTAVFVKDYWGRPGEAKAIKFFHDQYTQYWLSAVCRETLGSSLDANDEAAASRLGGALDAILPASVRHPTLFGALVYWLYTLTATTSSGSTPVPILLVPHLSPAGASFVARACVQYLQQRLLEPNILFGQDFRKLPQICKLEFADALAASFFDLPEGTLRYFLEATAFDLDDVVLRRLADGLCQIALSGASEARRLFASLKQTFTPLDRPHLVLARASNQLARQIKFVVKLLVVFAILSFEDQALIEEARAFLLRQYPLLIEALAKRRGGDPFVRGVRKALFIALERSGINQWDQAIGSLDGNNKFFVDDDGLVQRDALFEFYEDAVKIHNEVDMPLVRDSPFRQRAIALMSFRAESVIGYVAAAMLTIVLRRSPNAIEDIVSELIRARTPASLFHASLLLLNLRYSGLEIREQCLELLKSSVVPALLAEPAAWGKELLHCMTIVSFDPERHWQQGQEILDLVLTGLDQRAEESQLRRLGEHFAGVSFLPNAEVGRRLNRLLLDRKLLSKPKWRDCVLHALAGLCARRGEWFEELAEEFRLSAEEKAEVTSRAARDLHQAAHEMVYQAGWNRFLAYGLSSKGPLRYFLVRNLLGGLVQSNSVEEFSREFRRFVFETAAYYLTGAPGPNRWDVDAAEALAAAESRRRIGRGDPWPPRCTAGEMGDD